MMDIDDKIKIFNNSLLSLRETSSLSCYLSAAFAWFTRDKLLMKEKEKAKKVWKRCSIDSEYNLFKRLRNLIRLEVQKAKESLS